MGNIVEYILSLKSNQFESGISQADRSTHALENSFNSLKNTALGFFGAFAGYEFVSNSVKAFNDSAQASAQLDASLKSTSNAANLNREALDEQAESLMKLSLYDDDAITGAQALLATFTQVKDTIFMQAIPAIVDMSAKMGTDLQSSVIQVGKALQDPINGLTALRRVGIDFNDQQKATIKTMVETNNLAGAQAMILQELQKEFGGSAKAASEAGTGPFTVLKHEFQNVQEEIGGLVVALAKDLKPEISALVTWLGDAAKWLTENKALVKAVAEGIVIYAGAVTTVIPLIKALAVETTVATAATGGLAVATTAALAEVVAAVAAISALVYAYNELANAEENALRKQDEMASTHAKNTKKVLDESLALRIKNGEDESKARKAISDKMRTDAQNDLKTYQDELDKIEFKQKLLREQGFSSQADALEKGRMDMLENVKIYKAEVDAINSWATNKPASAKSPLIATPAKGASNNKSIAPVKAQGTKNVTINVHINDMVKTFTVNTTNIKQTAQQTKDFFTGLLMQSINDAQIVSEH